MLGRLFLFTRQCLSAAGCFGGFLRFFFSAARIFFGAPAGVNLALLGLFNGALFGFDNGGLTTILLGFRQIVRRAGR